MTASLKEKFETDVIKALIKELGRSNKNSLPKLEKVSVNVGVGKIMTQGNKDYSHAEGNLAAITGQKGDIRKARISVSNFKLREGVPVGIATTLRGRRMYDFVDRLVNVALPRVRDFQGISIKGFDGQGNYSLGIKDCSIFPEVNSDNINLLHGFQINFKTNADNDYEAYFMLKALGFPFKDAVLAPGEKAAKAAEAEAKANEPEPEPELDGEKST